MATSIPKSRSRSSHITLDLDLDYLEDPDLFESLRCQKSHHHNIDTGAADTSRLPADGADDISDSAEGSDTDTDSLDLDDFIKIILLGAQGVGKTSIIQQFVWTSYDDEYYPTQKKHTYYPTIIRNETYYGLKITDLPCIPYFPIDSYMEWTDFRFYGLRQATAYILVFDLSKNHIDATFQYIKSLRDQILESRAQDIDKVTLLVVGNKLDLMPNLDQVASTSSETKHPSLLETVASTLNGSGHTKHLSPYETARQNIITLVRQHWRVPYVECSAKYNYKLNLAFKELLTRIELNMRRRAAHEAKTAARSNRSGLLTAAFHRSRHQSANETREESHSTCKIL